MKSEILQRFAQHILSHTGLRVRQGEDHRLAHTLESRMARHHLTDPEDYLRVLTLDSASSQREWEELVPSLTVGETYFFRDSGQCALLREHILPELIARNRRTRSLRIWSAGCSTGEEPYSLAILVQELLPSYHDWHIRILGTDLNMQAITTARQGRYCQRSLRAITPAIRDNYFQTRQGSWVLNTRVQSMVAFQALNLLTDAFPSRQLDLYEFDLIICRNVFIYFDRAAVAHITAKFAKTLRVDGYLMTGHAELHDQNLSEFCVTTFSQSILYQRRGVPITNSQITFGKPPVQGRGALPSHHSLPVPHPKHPPSTPHPTPLARAESLYLQAREAANAGDYEAAMRHCQQALNHDNLFEPPYFLMAEIAELQGDLEIAKGALKRILFLSPSSVPAHLELGALYHKAKDHPRARKMHQTVCELLQALPPETVIDSQINLTAGELLPEVQRRLERFA